MFKYVGYTPVIDEYTTHIFNEKDEKCSINRFDVPYVSIEYENEVDFEELMAYQIPEIMAVEIMAASFNEAVKDTTQVQRMHNRANQQYFDSMHPVNILYPAVQRETWITQVAESNEYLSNGTEGTMITALAAAAGASIEAYANAVLVNKAEYDQFAADGAVTKEALLTELKGEMGIFSGGAVYSWVTDNPTTGIAPPVPPAITASMLNSFDWNLLPHSEPSQGGLLWVNARGSLRVSRG